MSQAYLITDEMLQERDRIASTPMGGWSEKPLAELHRDFGEAFETMSQAFIRLTMVKQQLDMRLRDMSKSHDILYDKDTDNREVTNA